MSAEVATVLVFGIICSTILIAVYMTLKHDRELKGK